jgi:lipopolysaccharide export system permease protein
LKILDRYTLKNFLVPFLGTFFVVLFILVMLILFQQFDKIAGRGLGLSVLLKFFGYTSLLMMPMALAIGVLLSSIMALGNLSENYELAAIKASGISLFRLLRPLLYFMIILTILNFLFLNYIFPVATYESKNLVWNIKKKQPSLALVAGSFNNDIPGFSIKFAKKYGEDNNLLEDVIIYDLRDKRYNNKVITAKKGEITSTPGSKYMTLVLKDGYYYEDIKPKRRPSFANDPMPFVKSHFKEHQLNFDISGLDKLGDNKYDKHYEMMSLKQLADEVQERKKPLKENLRKNIERYYKTLKAKELHKDTVKIDKLHQDILNNYILSNRVKVLRNASREIQRIHNTYKNLLKRTESKQQSINVYNTEFYKRLAFSLSVLVLFLIGAPLGSLIRKGGFGVPMIMAILIFVTYHFIGEMAKGMAKTGAISPFLGGWLSTIVMLPFGLFLLYKAVQDKGLFDFDGTLKAITNFFKKISKKRNKKLA